ncbi:MAG: DDE-type integrase/transposase/recombinase [Planctomycetia bacterium]|nr:DDE-type integrase/transposase/recombinase [Planctomycetia bacterium]
MTIDTVDTDSTQLQREVLLLRRRVQKLIALLRVLLVVFRISGYSLNQTRLSEGGNKRSLLQAIERSRSALPLRSLLRVIRLSPVRYHAWSREDPCALDDRSSCPRSSPQQLTATEVSAIQELVTSDDYRHVPTGTLARLAQRIGKVFASASTWYRLVRERRWRRPRQRVHPAAPKVGIRAARPNEVWHMDTTLIRLLDGSRVYLQAVIDNFSRRILAWKVSPTFNPLATVEILLTAAKGVGSDKPLLLVDGGVENFNGAVDELITSGLLSRVLAQTEITFSNSLIESWWRVLKHQWLFLNTLDTLRSVEKLVAFYVQEHNARLTHSAFRGQTPDEMYFGTGDKIPGELEAARRLARQARAEANRKRTCSACEPVTVSLN